MYNIILILILTSIILSVFLQTSRNIFLRNLGLILSSLVVFINYSNNLQEKMFVILFSVTLTILGFLSDYYSATLRTWFFLVSNKTIIYTSYITFIATFLISYIFNPGIANSIMIGSLLGAILGEFISQGSNKSLKKLLKYSLGTLVGLYGLGIKVLFSIQIAEIFIRNSFI
ncbi:MAG: hypothetical protein KatS3mg068_0587 [Candidatus Sericytochromatia bacterium]|nr:MAG: hypothetical protein KatS3mg068_0587 [Candidatus Sericytochromatia bacterium]